MIHIPDSIYPKDDQGNALCPKCELVVPKCTCPVLETPKPKAAFIRPTVRLDKSGRKGKVVTLITDLPRQESYLKDLAKQLKMKTGSGGTCYTTPEGGVVELQGDHQEVVEKFFKQKD